MFVNYRPDGQPAQSWVWFPDSVRTAEAELIEKRFEGTWEAFQAAVMEGSMRARRILLWHLLRREHPTLLLDDVDFAAGEVKVEFNKDELQAFYDEAAKSTVGTEQQREMVLARLRQEIATAPDGDQGKAPSKKRA